MRKILALLALLMLLAVPAWADSTLPALPAAGAAAGTDLIPTSQGGAAMTKQTASALATYFQSTLGTAALINTGTSGATLGLLNGTLTFSGNDTFSGVPLFTGLSAGTQVSCLGLDAGNHLVFNAAACGSGGGGNVSTSGSPATGNLTKFASSTTITNADLTGDVTTAGGVATTIAAGAVTGAKMATSPAIPGSPTTTTQAAKDNSTKIATTAYVDAPTGLTAGTSVSLAGPRQYFVCTGTCTVTPPVPVAGFEFCVMNDDNVAAVITLAALGTSARYENTARTAYGTAGTGTLVSGGAAADKVCIVGRDSTHYLTTSFNGTWTAN